MDTIRELALIENERANFRNLFKQTPEMVCILRGPEHVFEFVNQSHVTVLGFDATGMPVREAQPESTEVHGILDDVFRTGITAQLDEIPVTVTDRVRYFNLTFAARRDANGLINGVMILGTEVTEQVLARAELRESRELLEIALSSALMGVWSVDLKTGKTTLSKDARRVLGFAGDAEETSQAMGALLHPDDRDRAKRAWKASLTTGQPFQIECRINHRSKEYRWMLGRALPVRNEAGEIVRWMGTCIDIHEQKTFADRLKESKEETERLLHELGRKSGFLEAIIEQMPMVVVFAEAPSGRLIFANKQLNKVWRHGFIPSENFEGYREYIGFHPDGRRFEGKDWPLARAIAEKRVVAEDCDVLLGDGTRGVLRIIGAPVKNEAGELIAGIVLSEDITDRKRFEDARNESEATLKAVLDRLPVGVVISDTAGKITTMNAACREIWAGEKKVGLDEYGTYEGYWYESGKRIESEEWALARALRMGETLLGEVIRIKCFDGKEKIVLNSAVPVRLESGRLVGAIAVVQDITAQKSIEAELSRAKSAAESASLMKSAFLANMSHEIRTPLGAILGFTDLLKDPTIEAAEKQSYHEIISRNGEQLTSIINDILDLSKIEAGQVAIENLRVSPRAILEESVSLLDVRAKMKNITLATKVDSSLPESIGTDPTRLKQIFLNVLGNAIKFTSHGGVTARASYVRRADGKGAMLVEISDTGIGMNTEQQMKLFKAFTQADETMTRKFGGTGLGLALSKKLAEALGGDLRLLGSSLERGSTFTIEIEDRLANASDDVRLEKDRPGAGASADLTNVRVLLVEDSLDNQNLVWRMLSKRKAIVTVAGNGLEAISKAMSGSHDLILMDVQMPVMDGYTATQKLRELGYRKPIVALTAHAMNEVHHRCLEVGCTDFLPKPIDSKALIEKVFKYRAQPI